MLRPDAPRAALDHLSLTTHRYVSGVDEVWTKLNAERIHLFLGLRYIFGVFKFGEKEQREFAVIEEFEIFKVGPDGIPEEWVKAFRKAGTFGHGNVLRFGLPGHIRLWK